MPSLLFVAFLAIASLQGTFGAPCAQNLGSCVSKCKAKTGWNNHSMGNHTWGSPSSVVPSYSSGSTPAANLKGTPDYGKPTSVPIFRPTTLSAASMEPPLLPGVTIYHLWRRHGQMVANFSILAGNLVVCIYRWRLSWFLNAGVQKISPLVPEMGIRSHQPSNLGPRKFVRRIVPTI